MAKKEQNPDEVICVHVKVGETVVLGEHAYGDRASLQVSRRAAAELKGQVDEVDPNEVPDVGKR